MNKFDDILRENIKKAFSNYNSDHLADEGWDSFVALQKGRRIRTVYIPLWARAASILVIIGLGAFIAYRLSVRQTNEEIISAVETAAGKNEGLAAPGEKPFPVAPVAESTGEPAGRTGQAEKTVPDNQKTFAYNDRLLKTEPADNKSAVLHKTEENRFINPGILPVLPVSGAFDGFYKSTAIDELRPEYYISAGLAFEEYEAFDNTPDTEKSSGGRRFLAGLSGSGAQTGGSSSPASGVSLGLYLSQKITKRVSVRPGLALAMHSFGLESSGHPSAVNYTISQLSGTNSTPFSYEGRLNMLTVELPLNFVVSIFEKKGSAFFISAGASTLFYISQQFKADLVTEYTKTSYNTLTDEYFSETQYSTVEVEKEYGSLSRADFFGLANLSAGYSFPYNKTSTLLIEPFVQLPVNDLTSLDLRIRYAGVSMKVQFGKREQKK